MTRPLATLRVGARTAESWDETRQQTVHPSLIGGDNPRLQVMWQEYAGTGKTDRSISFNVEEAPAWLDYIAEWYADWAKNLSADSILSRIAQARRDGYQDGFKAAETRAALHAAAQEARDAEAAEDPEEATP